MEEENEEEKMSTLNRLHFPSLLQFHVKKETKEERKRQVDPIVCEEESVFASLGSCLRRCVDSVHLPLLSLGGGQCSFLLVFTCSSRIYLD